jgi:hypothetical protein
VSLLVGLLAAGLFAASAVVLATGGDTDTADADEPTAEQLRLAALQVPDEPSTIDKEKPPEPKRLDVIPSEQDVAAAKQEEASAPKKPEVKVPPELVGTPAEGMPAVSAGKNGTRDKPSPRLMRMDPEKLNALTDMQADAGAVLIGKTALAPGAAPEAVQRAISAANEIVGTPYIWGGGHASWYSKGYDCSGAVSYALGGAGLLKAPLTSGALESWGAPGPGKWITVYANAGHTFMVIAGLRWDTAGRESGTGPAWQTEPASTAGYTVRHPPGL